MSKDPTRRPLHNFDMHRDVDIVWNALEAAGHDPFDFDNDKVTMAFSNVMMALFCISGYCDDEHLKRKRKNQ